MKAFALLPLLLVFSPPPPAAREEPSATRSFAVMEEFDRMAARPLWPNFDPRRVPVEIYDGQQTFLFRHPNPPAEFAEVAGRAGVRVFRGQHESVRANTHTKLGGVLVATAIIGHGAKSSTRESAALIVHEAFHVFQSERHPAWGGDEGELFLYPLEDAAQLRLRRLETEALRRGLPSRGRAARACWAVAAIKIRRERFGRLPAGSAKYERGTELKEGLANYVQSLAEGGTKAALPAGDFAADEVRARAYATGRALALLLDAHAPAWKQRLEAGEARSLDELLEEALPRGGRPCELPRAVRAAARARAAADVRNLLARKGALRRDFLAQPGWTLVVLADDGEPLWPQGFDPLNLRRLDGGEVLHTRWLKLGNAGGSIEVLDRRSLTVAAGAHPLFNGMRKLTVAGLPGEPSIRLTGTKTIISADGVSGELTAAPVERAGRTLTLRLGKPAE